MGGPAGQPPTWRIVEVGAPGPIGRAAALAGKLFAGYGHDVVQVVTAPDVADTSDALWRDTGKRRTVVDWRNGGPRSALRRLLAAADVLLDATGPAGLTAYGLDGAMLRSRYPELVAVQLSAFGHSGPRAGDQATDITLYAASGLMYATGDDTREPLNAGVPIASDSAGLKAHVAALMGLYRRRRDGRGDLVELALAEAAMDNIEIALAQWLNAGRIARRNRDEHATTPWRTCACADGEAVITAGPARHWQAGARLFEAPEPDSDALADPADRIEQRARVAELMRPWLNRTPRRAVFHAGQRAGLAWGYVATLEEALTCEQTAARHAATTQTTPDGRRYRLPDAPFHATDMDWTTRAAPAVTETIDWAPCDAGAAIRMSVAAPLAGVRVLDFTHGWAGPHAARVLADYGAEVIKIEYPGRLDAMRGGCREHLDAQPRFWQLHRSKRSVMLDLKVPEHHACARRLAAGADLVIENSRPGVMARLGLDYAALRLVRADIVMVSMSAHGASGPHADYAGYGATVEALSGLQSLTGYRGDATTRRVREVDVLNGAFGACAAMAALVHRQHTGRGQWIDLSQRETCSWLAGQAIVAADLDRPPERRGNRHRRFAPQGCYCCAGDDGWLALTVRDTREWHALCALMAAPDWMRAAALDRPEARQAQHDAIDAEIAAWTAGQAAAALERQLQRRGLAAAEVRHARDLAEDAHLAARDWFVVLEDARLPGLPFRFARGGGGVRHRGPALGADNVLLAVLGGLEELPAFERSELGTAFDDQPPRAAKASAGQT